MAKYKKKKGKVKPFDPALDTGERRPVTAVVAVGDINDKYSGYPSNALNPKRLARIFMEADQGDVMSQMELFEEIEEKDAHVMSQMQTRKLAVTGLDWNLQPAGETDRDRDVANFVEHKIRKIPRLREVMLDILDAIGKGISISEIDWEVDAAGMYEIAGVEWVHPKKLTWDYLTDELKICTKEYPSGISLPENKFVVHRYKARSGHPSRAGILRVVSWMYLFKNYDVKDWVSFCEVFGMPLRLGKYSAAASKEDKEALAEAIINLGTDAAGIIPDSANIEFIESNKTTSAEIYENLARYCDEQISKAIVGQTLTADTGGGSYAQGKVHADVRRDLTIADAQSLAETITESIVRPLVLYNFGPDVGYPAFQFDCKDPEDLRQTVDIYKILAVDMGLAIPKDHIYSKFAIPEPEEGEDVLEPWKLHQTQPVMQPMKLKSEIPYRKEQEQLDGIVQQAANMSTLVFQKMFEPILKILGNETDLKELKTRLEDPKELKKLLDQMDSPELQDMLSQAMYLSELMGRGSS